MSGIAKLRGFTELDELETVASFRATREFRPFADVRTRNRADRRIAPAGAPIRRHTADLRGLARLDDLPAEVVAALLEHVVPAHSLARHAGTAPLDVQVALVGAFAGFSDDEPLAIVAARFEHFVRAAIRAGLARRPEDARGLLGGRLRHFEVPQNRLAPARENETSDENEFFESLTHELPKQA